MGKECWVGPAYSVEPISCTFGLVAHPLELAAYPPDDIGIDPLQGRTQLRLIEVAVVGDPAADAWVVHLGQFGQGFVVAMMKRPAADFPADARQCLRASGGLKTVREGRAWPAVVYTNGRGHAGSMDYTFRAKGFLSRLCLALFAHTQ